MNYKPAQIEVHYNHHCGDDLTPVNAARKSFASKSDWATDENGNRTLSEKDIGLLEYLVRGIPKPEYISLLETLSTTTDINEIETLIWKFRKTPVHQVPYAHSFLSVDVKAPIFCRAQLVKHKFMLMSEFSRRYITDDIEIFWPLVFRLAADNVKQGSSADFVNTETLENELSMFKNETLENFYNTSIRLYETLLTRKNIAPEMARMVLPQALMTSWTWSGTLTAFVDMCNLRLDSHSQYESRMVAQEVRNILFEHFPLSSRLLIDYPQYARPITTSNQ